MKFSVLSTTEQKLKTAFSNSGYKIDKFETFEPDASLEWCNIFVLGGS